MFKEPGKTTVKTFVDMTTQGFGSADVNFADDFDNVSRDDGKVAIKKGRPVVFDKTLEPFRVFSCHKGVSEEMKKKTQKNDGVEVAALYKCPCCDEKAMRKLFVRFTDPCICKSGKLFRDCCYKKNFAKE